MKLDVRVLPVLVAGLVLVTILVPTTASTQGQLTAVDLPVSAETKEILDHMSIVYLDDGQGGTVKTIDICGINVRITNGLGATNGYPTDPDSTDPTLTVTNGLGNLIVGYNELGNFFGDDRTGSHNLVFGHGNSFSSFGGLVGPNDNTIFGAFASVSGGRFNRATGSRASVSGGFASLSSGPVSSVSGGYNRSVTGQNDWRAGTLFEDF